jgi:hypothetical protein
MSEDFVVSDDPQTGGQFGSKRNRNGLASGHGLVNAFH